MAEFVEHALEQLLPAFEQLKLTQLLQQTELDDFIKQCRAFEYRCSRRTKVAKIYIQYAQYVVGRLALIERRRQEMKYLHRYDEIERPLKQKCAFLYRICSHRFRKLLYYNEEISFLREANMLKACSQAYTRLLQVHGNQADNFVRAARFEFFDNHHSVDSARSIVAMGLRKFPGEPQLWLTHFEIELRYVQYILQRRQYLLDQEQQSKRRNKKAALEMNNCEDPCTVDDDVLELKLVRIVYELSMKNIEDPKQKIELLRNCHQIAQNCGKFADDLRENLQEHLNALDKVADDEGTEVQNHIPDEELFAIDTEGIGEEVEVTNGRKAKEVVESKEKKKKAERASVLDGFNPEDPEIKQLLSKATLTEDYDKKPLEEVLAVSARQQKKQRKAQRESTAGKAWFTMPATEMTDERRHDLELVQMRDALDPKQHYKKPDRAELPKYFQMGRIVESKADFFSARVPRKQRKRTMVEELMEDHELLARNKRRYTEIVRRKEATHRGTFQRGAFSRRSRRKNKQKSH